MKNKIDNIEDIELANFKQIYRNLCEEKKDDLMKLRKNVKIKMLLSILIFMESCIWLSSSKGILYVVLICVAVFCGAFLVIILIKSHVEYIREYNKQIILEFVKHCTPNLTYLIEDFKDKTEDIKLNYNNSNFDNKKYNKFYIKNYISGNLNNGTYVQMMDTMVAHKIGKSSEVLFNGNFVIIDIPKDFYLKIYSQNAKYANIKNLINTNDLKFNECFRLDSLKEYNIEERLNIKLTNFMTEFRKKYEIDFDIVIKEKLYIRFYTGDIFSIGLSGDLVNEELIYKYYVINKFVNEFVEVLEEMH